MGMNRFPALVPALLLTACVSQYYPSDALPTRNWPSVASCPTPARAAAETQALLHLMNDARASAGLGALVLDPRLTATAQAYACENAARQSLDHLGSDGSDLLERFRRSGLKPALAAENTGLGYQNAEAAFAGWMASPHHRDNILQPQVTSVGIGLADGAKPIWVVDLLASR
jgi:uncharacterized protein YkwD